MGQAEGSERTFGNGVRESENSFAWSQQISAGSKRLVSTSQPRRAVLTPTYQSTDWSVQQKQKAEVLKTFSQKHLSHKKDKETMYLSGPRRHRFFTLISVQCGEAQVYSGSSVEVWLFHGLRYRRKWCVDWNQIFHFLHHFLNHQAPCLQNGRFWFDTTLPTFRHLIQRLSCISLKRETP